MSTADFSGANEDVLTHNTLPHSQRNVPPSPEVRLPFIKFVRVPRAALGTVAALFGLCGAFVAFDVVQSQMAATHRVSLSARLASAGLQTADPDATDTALNPLTRALDSDLWLRVTDRAGETLVSHGTVDAPLAGILPDLTAVRSIAGPLGAVEVGVGQQAVLLPVAVRTLIALTLAGLAAAWVVRRARRADALHQAQALSAALNVTSDGAIVWNADHTLASVSDALRKSAPVTAALLKRGITYSKFLDGLRQTGDLTLIASDRSERRLRLVLPVGETWDMREMLTADGRLITRLTDVSDKARLRSEVARLRNRVGEMADEVQTQRVRGDAASRSKTLFLGQLSHSIRTPLNHIIGFADLLRHQSYGPLGDQRYLGYAANIKQSGESLLDMLANMLELAEFDSGHRVLNKEPIRLGELFDWVEARYAEQARRAGIHLAVERSDERTLTGDSLCLKRLMGNIVDNSLKFTPAGGSLTIAAWPTDDGVVLEFTDTGIGIAADTLTVLNTSFALGNESNGNGIAIARAIAELSGGQLQINSSPGIGTTVAVVLPLKPARSASGNNRAVA